MKGTKSDWLVYNLNLLPIVPAFAVDGAQPLEEIETLIRQVRRIEQQLNREIQHTPTSFSNDTNLLPHEKLHDPDAPTRSRGLRG